MKNILKIFLVQLFVFNLAWGQDGKSCGFDKFLLNNPAIKKAYQEKNEKLRNTSNIADPNMVYTIPVVFVLFHLGNSVGSGANITDQQVANSVAKMNRGLRATGEYLNLGLDTKIQLQLAQFDSNCSQFSGIVRINASSVPNYSNGFSIYDDTMMSNLQALVPNYLDDEVIKIFVVDDFIEYDGWGNWWGTMIVEQHIARNSNELLIHEIGHTLSLSHTFQSDDGQCAPNSDPENQGDYISDTDPHLQNDYCVYKSPTTINSCTNQPFGNVLKNFMSYSWDCIDRFTPKQVEKMRNGLVTIRPKWINSKYLTGMVLTPIANSVTKCSPGSVTLTASGCSGTYNWYASSSGGSSLGTGATFNTPSINSTTTYYVSCVEGNCVSSRTPVQAIINNTLSISCYCNSVANYTGDEDILSVNIGDLNNSSTCSTTGSVGSIINRYSNYTNLSPTNFLIGTPIPYSIQIGTCGGNYWNSTKVFIDFNHNGSFEDEGETVIISSASFGANMISGTFLIPSNALTGITFMRIVNVETSAPSIISACNSYDWGETEDYKINIINNCTPPAAPAITSASRCGTGTVTLSASGCSGTYNWYAASTGGASLASTASYTTPSLNSTTNYYVSCTVGACTSTRTIAIATIKTIPVAPTLSASPSSITSGQSSTLTASNCAGIVTWSNSLGTGTSKSVSPTSTTTYTATCSVNGCVSNNGSVTVTVGTCNVAAPTTASASRCSTGTVTLSASGCSGGLYVWYSTNIGGNYIFASNNSTFTTPSLASTTNYYVECFNNDCTSPRTIATATIKTIPSAPTLLASPSSITSGQSSTLTASNCAGTVTWSNSLGTSTSKTVSPTVTSTYTATCTVNGCTSANGSVTVTVNTSNPCPNTINHSGNIVTGIYQAGESIISTANLGNNSIYYSGKTILLNPGFQVGPAETFLAQIQGCASTIPTNGLVAYYSFNYNNGFNDLSGNNNTGQLFGIPGSMSRKENNDAFQWGGVSFNARRYVVSNASQIQFSNAMSISFWYNLLSYTGMDGYGQSNTSGYHVAIGKEGDRNGFYIGISNDIPNSKQSINFTNNNNNTNNFNISASPTGTNTSNLNKWNHVVCTVSSNIIRMYINGVLVNSVNATPNFSGANTANSYIGTMWALSSTWYPFNGGIDELRIYNRALSDFEILQIYNAEK